MGRNGEKPNGPAGVRIVAVLTLDTGGFWHSGLARLSSVMSRGCAHRLEIALVSRVVGRWGVLQVAGSLGAGRGGRVLWARAGGLPEGAGGCPGSSFGVLTACSVFFVDFTGQIIVD